MSEYGIPTAGGPGTTLSANTTTTLPAEVLTTRQWAVRHVEDGQLVTTTRSGLYGPELPMSEERAREWVRHMSGYVLQTRTITTVTTGWETPTCEGHGHGHGADR